MTALSLGGDGLAPPPTSRRIRLPMQPRLLMIADPDGASVYGGSLYGAAPGPLLGTTTTVSAPRARASSNTVTVLQEAEEVWSPGQPAAAATLRAHQDQHAQIMNRQQCQTVYQQQLGHWCVSVTGATALMLITVEPSKFMQALARVHSYSCPCLLPPLLTLPPYQVPAAM